MQETVADNQNRFPKTQEKSRAKRSRHLSKYFLTVYGLFQIFFSKNRDFINRLRNLYSDFGLKTLKFLDDFPIFN